MTTYLDARCRTHPVFPGRWITEVRLYGDTWTTVEEGDLFLCALREAWITGLSPHRTA